MDAAVPVGAQNAPHSDLENRTGRGFPQRPHASSEISEEHEDHDRNPASHTKILTLLGADGTSANASRIVAKNPKDGMSRTVRFNEKKSENARQSRRRAPKRFRRAVKNSVEQLEIPNNKRRAGFAGRNPETAGECAARASESPRRAQESSGTVLLQDLSTSQRYMHFSPAAIARAIQLLDRQDREKSRRILETDDREIEKSNA